MRLKLIYVVDKDVDILLKKNHILLKRVVKICQIFKTDYPKLGPGSQFWIILMFFVIAVLSTFFKIFTFIKFYIAVCMFVSSYR